MIWLFLIGAILLGDGWIKRWAEKNLKEKENREILGGKILLRKLHNPGFVLQKGKDIPWAVKIVPMVVWMPVAICYLLILGRKGSFMKKLGGALMIGGGGSNLADRWTKGYVTDYFSFNVNSEKIRRIVFNLSDVMILVGGILTVLSELMGNKK